MKDVIISINSIHSYGRDEEDKLEFTTDGYYFYEDGTGCLSYMESEVTGMEGTRTSVIVSPQQVVVDRDGMITSRMIFQEGEKNSLLYNTPYGTATMGIDTRKIEQRFDEDGGELEIDYVVDMEHAVVTRNIFQISVKQMGEQCNG
ncbi:MAG: DUF1934 domain-containing protein [Oscillospiraceae bacterium]|jgi:uncharacterized beta-barrel protein YwiB (DUF1934 family)|nr:DUF1934 domain-containing protein [Oscillospiraceae bacterium]